MSGSRVVAVAIRVGDMIATQPAPARHADILAMLYNLNRTLVVRPSGQGFLTDAGEFVDRKQARRIAVDADQLLPRHHPGPELYSEDVW